MAWRMASSRTAALAANAGRSPLLTSRAWLLPGCPQWPPPRAPAAGRTAAAAPASTACGALR
eukprot:12786536-Alexandrium_andersonii.AAC.1